MKWNEKTVFYKTVDIVMILSAVAFLALAIINLMDFEIHESIPNLCISVFWFCTGVSNWKTNRTMAILVCVLSAVWLLIALILLF